MGWLLRRIDNQFGVTFSETMTPENPDTEIYEVVESDSLVKPQSQLDEETDAFKLALRGMLIEIVDGSTPEGFAIRTHILTESDEFKRIRARFRAQDDVIAGAWTTPAQLKTAWAAMKAAHPMPDIDGEDVKTALKKKAASGLAD